MARGVDDNTMYQILNGIFGREANENYRSNTRSNLGTAVADLRNAIAGRNNMKRNEARKNKYYNGRGGYGQDFGGIGWDSNGAYTIDANGNKIYNTQYQYNGIGADEDGIYGVGYQQNYNNNLYDNGVPLLENGSLMDAWRGHSNGFLRNPNRSDSMLGGDSVTDAWNSQPSNVMFQGIPSRRESDHGMNITDQTIGRNYNNRIDGQVGGLGIPRSPQGGGGNFTSVLGNNTGIFGKNLNPSQPPNSLNDLAHSIGGQNNASANDLSRYLGDEYNRGRWIQDDYEQRGVNDPVISMLRYDTMISPLVEKARDNRLKDLFMRSNNRNLSDEERMEARLQLAAELEDPEFIDKMEYNKWKRQKERDEWDLDRISKGIRNKAAEQAMEDKKNNKQIQLNAQKLSALFGDGKIYEMPLNETMEDTGLQKTDKEVVSGLNLLNTYSRKFFNTDLSANGGWRSEEHQKRLYKEQGKEPFMGSLHLKGKAVDIDVSKLSDAQREELMGFAEKLGFSTTYHDIGNGIHLHVELGDGRHLTDASVLMSNAGLKPSKDTKNKKETGSKYDSQTLADMVNSTYPEGKTRATDAERGEIGNYMAGIVPLVASPQDNWAQTAEKVYNYYQNTVGAGKGWTLNSEEFSNLVGRAVHKYFLDATGVDIPVNTISGYVFAKFDPESQKRMADAKKAAEENKDKPKTIEEEAEQVLGKNSKTKVNKEKSEEQKPRVGSKLANDSNQPITFNGIMSGTERVADKLRVNPNQYTDPNLTWHW